MRRDGAKPRVVEPELGAVAVEADDEFLAGANADVLAALREVGLGLGDEAIAHRFDVAPIALVREQLSEGRGGESVRLHVAENPTLELVELGPIVLVARAAAPIRENVVVELVGRLDAATLDRLRDAVCAMREHPVHAA